MLNPWIIQQLRKARALDNEQNGRVSGGLKCDMCEGTFSRLIPLDTTRLWICVKCYDEKHAHQ